MRHSLRETLEKALEHHKAGRLHRAEEMYRKVIAVHPDEPDALHLLSLIACRKGHYDVAERRVRRAIAVMSRAPAEFYDTLGGVLVAQGKAAEAVPFYQQALAFAPGRADTHKSLGSTLCSLGRAPEAAAHFEEALRLSPDDCTAYSNMGTVFLDRREPEKAARYFERAIELDPCCAEAWCNLGHALSEQGDQSRAIICLEKALAIQPNLAAAYDNMGCTYHRLGRMTEGLRCLEKALELAPDNPRVHNNLGNNYKEQLRLNEALAAWDRAIELQPNYYDALWNRSLVLFMVGQIERGWAEYDWGWPARRRNPERRFPLPWWDGGPLSGKRLLIWMEQGVGDEMIFAGMIPELEAVAAQCIVECEHRLVRLFARSFPRVQVVPRTEPPRPAVTEADLQIPAGSAARWLRPSLDRFPHHRGYLRADPAGVARWRDRLAALGPGLKVGICWRSSVNAGVRGLGVTELRQWDSVFAVPGVHFVNLQYDDCRAELEEARSRTGVAIHTWPDIDLKQDLDEVAALMTALDLTVSVGTAVACMAGALGRPVWQLTLASAGECWTMGQRYCPWFPSMRLYERIWDRRWEEVLERVAGDLAVEAARGLKKEGGQETRLPGREEPVQAN